MMPPAILLANLLEGNLGAFLSGLVAAGPRTVPRDMELRTYLDEALYPRWYQGLLRRFDRVTISRKQSDGSLGAEEPSQSSTDVLRKGDLVRVNEGRTGDAFEVELDGARDGARDYVLVPDDDPYDPFLSHLQTLHFRAGSHMFSRRSGEATLQTFVREVGRAESVEGPPRDLIVVSHAHWSGQLAFAPSQPAPLGTFFTYEDVDRLGTNLRLPDEHLLPRNNANTPARLIFTGCEFGHAQPFLSKLRDAINPKLAAIAPKFLYGIAKEPARPVFIEYMAKGYTVYSKLALTRAELIATLSNMNLRDTHGDLVKDEEWDPWVPLEPWPAPTAYFHIGRGSVTGLSFVKPEEEMPAVNVSVDQTTFEANPLGLFKAAVAALPPNPGDMLSSAHPFPMWKRFGLANANKLIETLDWQFRYTAGSGGGANTVVATGTVYRYSLEVPIVARDQTKLYAERRLLGNYWGPGPSGSGHVLVHGDFPLPKFPLAAHPASNTKYWNAIAPA